MDERQLIGISLILGILGIIALYLISENTELWETPINKISGDKSGDIVKITGIVKNIVTKDKVSLITIEQPCTFPIVSFDRILVKEGDSIEVTGTIKEYNGKTEVVAEKIKILGYVEKIP